MQGLASGTKIRHESSILRSHLHSLVHFKLEEKSHLPHIGRRTVVPQDIARSL